SVYGTLFVSSGGSFRSARVTTDGLFSFQSGSYVAAGTRFDGAGGVVIDGDAVLSFSDRFGTGSAFDGVSVAGPGGIIIDAGSILTVQNRATIDLSGQPAGSGCADPSQSSQWGHVAAYGTLLVIDSTIQNTNVDVPLALQGDLGIINNDIHLIDTGGAAGK